ncbi:MAG: hypothetical protein IH991_22340 [Planctomycetes bacterium]|nr:hypothetical protein [Planctomycetota bacterium]
MIAKILAIASLAVLPLSATAWYRSHAEPYWHRSDLTLYKSMWVRLEDGVFDMELLSMPTKVASKSEFVALVDLGKRPKLQTFRLTTRTHGKGYRTTAVAFPLSLSTIVLALSGTIPFALGPAKRWRRKRNGWCVDCGYNLSGNRSGRCPECGTRLRKR